MNEAFSVEAIEQLFARKDGSYGFARWGRQIAPVVFGVDDDTLGYLKETIAQTVAVTGGTLAEIDPELGTNFMWFFCTEWDEVAAVPDLEKLVPDLQGLVKGLNQKNVNEHRMFIFDKDGSIKSTVQTTVEGAVGLIHGHLAGKIFHFDPEENIAEGLLWRSPSQMVFRCLSQGSPGFAVILRQRNRCLEDDRAIGLAPRHLHRHPA